MKQTVGIELISMGIRLYKKGYKDASLSYLKSVQFDDLAVSVKEPGLIELETLTITEDGPQRAQFVYSGDFLVQRQKG